MSILAIDQGTTSTRALLLRAGDDAPRLVYDAKHRQSYPRPGWVEHDPLELVGHLRAAIAAAGQPLAGIGIDNQGESCLAWDAVSREPLSPVVVWQDRRTASDLDRLSAEGAGALVHARAGLPLDPYFSAAKLGWILRHLPAAQAAHRAGRLHLGTTDAYFLDVLTGQCVTDLSTASRTSLLDLAAGAWDPGLCALFGVPMECLPRIVDTTGEIGHVATAHGPVPVLASIVDQQAALHGAGCRVPGEAKITFGTGAFALMLTGAIPPAGGQLGLLPTVAWRKAGEPAARALEGGVFTAGAAVDWGRRLGLFTDYATIDGFLGAPAIQGGLVFVPALAGLGAPHWRPAVRGAWLGLGLDDDGPRLMRAVLEGIAFRAAELLAAMERSLAPAPILPVDGGLTRNAYFVQFLADILGRSLRIPESPETTAFGTLTLVAGQLGRELAPAPTRVIAPAAGLGHLRSRFAEALARVT